jgi:prefoldin subunit 5
MDQELVQYLEERFDRQEQRFDARFDRIEQRLDSHDQTLASIDQRYASIDRRFGEMNERIDEVKRHAGVLAEGLRYEVRLVAEGFAVFVEGRYTQDQATIDRQFRETHALIRTSYVHLQQQHDQLSQRVDNLERKPPT